MIVTLARKSLTARWGRNLFIFLVIGFVVSFVAGTFVLTDSIASSFDKLIEENVDASSPGLIVRTKTVDGDDSGLRDAVPADLVTALASVPGVAYVQGDLFREAVLELPDQTVLAGGQGPPVFAVNYPRDLGPGNTLDGAPPQTIEEIVIDAATADTNGLDLNDVITVAADGGNFDMKIVGFVQTEESALGFAPTFVFIADEAAQTVLGAENGYDSLTVGVEPGETLNDVRQAVAQALPDNTEVLTGDELTEEIQDDISDDFNSFISVFQTGLLIFAAISAFVGAFIINNMFAISIGQRLRELALLRAVGASRRQMLRLVLSEAGLLALIATLAGIAGGVVLAWLLLLLLKSLVDLPTTTPVIGLRTIIAAFAVGVGVVLISAVVPAVRAARIPPVAAMRPEVGYKALAASRRLIGGIIATAIGVTAFLYGLFGPVSGGVNLSILIGGGALVIFLGATSLSTTVANPVSRALGWPIARLFGTPGAIARDNAARSPRRTARTASALMIGVAIISSAALFASSLKASINSVLEQSVVADFAVLGVTGGVFSDQIPDSLQQVAALGTVSSERRVPVTVTSPKDSQDLEVVAIDPATYDDVIKLQPSEGSYADMAAQGGIGVYRSAADDAGIGLGDTVDLTFPNGEVQTLPVSMIFDDGTLGDWWFMPYDVVKEATTAQISVSVTWVNAAPGTPADVARPILDQSLQDYPQVQVQTNADFRESVSMAINIMQTVVTVLLSGAVLLSFVSIAVTLALSVIERTREIGLLRAVGMTRLQLSTAIQGEAIIVTVFGVLVGLVMGLLIGFALLKAVPDNFITVIAPPYFTIIFVVFLAVIAAFIAALYPAAKASRMDVLDAISAD